MRYNESKLEHLKQRVQQLRDLSSSAGARLEPARDVHAAARFTFYQQRDGRNKGGLGGGVPREFERKFQEAQKSFARADEDQKTAAQRSKEGGQLYESCLKFLRDHGLALTPPDHPPGDGEILYTDDEIKQAAAWGKDTDRMGRYTNPDETRPAKPFRRPSAISKYILGQEEQQR